MLNRVIGDTEERKAEVVAMIATAPMVRHLAAQSYISQREALELLRHLAQDTVTLLFTPEIAQILSDLGLDNVIRDRRLFATADAVLNSLARPLLPAGSVENAVSMAMDAPRAGYTYPTTDVVPSTAVNSIPTGSTLGVSVHGALSVAATAAAPLAVLAVNSVANSIAGRLFRVPQSQALTAGSNMAVGMLMSPALALVVSSTIRGYANASTSGNSGSGVTVSAVVFLGASCLVYRGLAYSVASAYEQESNRRNNEGSRGPRG
jgi:hypothetical protein